MPLSEPMARTHLHTRTVTCQGFRRDDGLWDIEGHLVDVKSRDLDNAWRGTIAAGEPVHDMWIRLTLDDDFVIQAIETASDATPYAMCGDVAPNFQALKGVRVARGWRRAVRRHVGGVRGCTHLVEMLGHMATVAYQTMYPFRTAPQRAAERPGPLNSCHAWSETSPVIKRLYPEWYRGE